MPIYEYKCQECQNHFETRQSATDDPLTECEKCGGKLEKQWSLSGFQFKGAGWYVTDYAGKKGASTPEKSTTAESTVKPESASNSNSDSSAPAKTDTTTKKD